MTEEALAEQASEEPIVQAENEEAAPSDDSNESTEQAKAPEGEEAPAPKEPKKNSFQKRIDELTRQRYEAEQKAAQYEEQLAQYQRQVTETAHMSQKPTLEMYNYDQDAWAKAMDQWAEQGIKRQQEAIRQAEQQKAYLAKQSEINRKIQEKTLKAMEKYPDFQAKVSDPSVPSLAQVSPAAYEALITSDNMGEVAYYLANNPAEIYQYGSMSPIEAVRAIARLEAKLTPATKPTTKAPPPPSQINGRAESTIDPDSLPINEWMKMRQKQLKR